MQDLSNSSDKDMRRFERRPYHDIIGYSVSVLESDQQRKLKLKGMVFDISDAGIGIQSDYPLQPGHTLWFDDRIDKRTGIVRWSKKLDRNSYRAGLVFDTMIPYGRGYAEQLQDDELFVEEEREEYVRLFDAKTQEYVEKLKRFESKCNQPDADEEKLMDEMILLNDWILEACAEFEEAFSHDREFIKDAQKEFRMKTDPLLSKSYLVYHIRTWPRGYQGDYKALESAYKNSPVSSGIGYYIDRYMLAHPLRSAVANRIKMLEEMLRDDINKRKHPAVLNIACGSCRELMGLAPDILDANAHVVCIDSDNDSLFFSQERLSYTGALSHIELRKYNALRMFDHDTNMMEFGKQDIIYSVGLFDYLPSDFLVKLLGALYELLSPGGLLIAAFKDANRYRSQDFHWLANWDGFLQRTDDDFRAILHKAGIPAASVSETRDSSGIIVFKLITRETLL